MRGIERVPAAVLLMGAVGGAAVFASHSGSPGADAVRLGAPPEQHLSGPGAVLIAPTPADRSQALRVVRAAPAVVSIPAIGHAGGAVALIHPAKQTVRLRPITPLSPVPVTAPTPSPSPSPVPVPAPAAPVQAPPAVTGPVVTAAPEAPRAPAASDPVPAPPAPTADPPSAIPAPPIQVTPVPVPTLPDPPPDLHGLAPGPTPTPVDAAATPVQAPPHFKAGPTPGGD
jgi:hypothetical protein